MIETLDDDATSKLIAKIIAQGLQIDNLKKMLKILKNPNVQHSDEQDLI